MRHLLYPALVLAHGVALAGSLPVGSAAGGVPVEGVRAYVSALATYRSYADQPVESWSEANDRVGRIGGWMAYARESHAMPANAAVPSGDTMSVAREGVSPPSSMDGVPAHAARPHATVTTPSPPAARAAGAAATTAHEH